MKCDKVIG